MKINPKLKEFIEPISNFILDPDNARVHDAKGIDAIAASLEKFGQQIPLVVDQHGKVRAGNGRLEAARKLGWDKIAVIRIDSDDPSFQKAFAIADNRTGELATWDDEKLVAILKELNTAEFNLEASGFSEKDFDALVASLNFEAKASGSLAEKFGVPPFSILDARQGYWRDRKAAWLALGIESEVGRGANLLKMSDTMLQPDPKARAKVFGTEGNIAGTSTGTSIFDPVLCELIYRWFAPLKGQVIDPFAGGSVRGIVAGKLGMKYFGVDLRAEQIEANESQLKKISCKEKPMWKTGDSLHITKLAGKMKADLIFSCPPYFDLEQYSKQAGDLSNMAWAGFQKAYKAIVKASVDLLKPNSFACFVIGDIRDEKGFYRNFTGLTVDAFEEAGAKFYNEAILITSAGTLPLRAGRSFTAGRKLGKTHQNVLIFYKGDPKQIQKRLGETDFGNFNETPGE